MADSRTLNNIRDSPGTRAGMQHDKAAIRKTGGCGVACWDAHNGSLPCAKAFTETCHPSTRWAGVLISRLLHPHVHKQALIGVLHMTSLDEAYCRDGKPGMMTVKVASCLVQLCRCSISGWSGAAPGGGARWQEQQTRGSADR